jgi:hypothetical protein
MKATMQHRRDAARRAARFLLPLLVLGGGEALAEEFCVGSVAELDAALAQAASASAAPVTTTIRLKQGTYHVGSSRLSQVDQSYFHALELLGGYNSDCSARTVNPDNTVFDADASTYFRFEPRGDLLIEGIRFQNIANFRVVSIWSAADDLTVRVRNNAFVGVGLVINPGQTPELESVGGLSARVINNRVHGYPGVPGFNVQPVYMAGLSQIRFTGNTIADNLGEHGVKLCANTDVWLVDNIAWNNAGDDFRVFDDCSDEPETGEARSRSNLYQSASLVPVGDSGSNLVGTDPLFVDAAAGNYRLQNASPAVNTGVTSSSMADIDLAGNPRVVGSEVDRGAYESAFDDTIATTLTVTTAVDSGPGSLRQAILDANVNDDFNFINFDIPGACPRVIVPTSADLPPIVNGVRIDGWTQPGSVSNTRSKGDNATRCIVIHGGGGRSTGLQFNGAADEQFWLQGVAFAGFSPGGGSGVALRLVGGNGNLVRGNQFGARLSPGAGSLVLSPSDTNIVLTGFSSSSIGGESPAHRNVIADAIGEGILITSNTFFASTGNDIVDNLIGSFALELSAAGNGTGLRIQTSGNSVRENTIVNSSQDGVLMDVAAAHHNTLEHNRIGVRDTICTGNFCFGGPAGNGRIGVFLSFGPHDNVIYDNTIQNNDHAGIAIGSSSGATSQRNWLIGNSLYNNLFEGTSFNEYNGADNDAAPAQQTMANRGLNYPVPTGAHGSASQGTVEGTLSSTNGSYIIDIFSSAQPDDGYARGEAQHFHKSFFSVTISNAAPDQNGSASFSIPFSSSIDLTGRVITLTATDSVGNTSELSAPVVYLLSDAIFADGFE